MAGDNVLSVLTRKNYVTGTYYPSEGRHSIYICCAGEYSETARKLANTILRINDCIVICRNGSGSGKNIMSSSTEKAIAAADAVILLVTPGFSLLNDIVAEINAAKRKRTPIVPIVVSASNNDINDAEELCGRKIRCPAINNDYFNMFLRQIVADYSVDYATECEFRQFYEQKNTAPVESFKLKDKLKYAEGFIKGTGAICNRDKAVGMLNYILSADGDEEVKKEALWKRGFVHWLNGNYKLSAADWHDAAVKGYAKGYYSLGCLYFFGEGTSVNLQKAVGFFERAYNSGISDACTMLGYCSINGMGCEKSNQNAEQWLRRGIEMNNAECCKALSKLYLSIRNNGEALRQYENACYLHEPDSVDYYELAGLYMLNSDCQKAVHYYECSAQLGSKEACLRLGEIYEKGNGVEPNIEKANNYYRMAGLVKPSVNTQTSTFASLSEAFKEEEQNENTNADYSELYKFSGAPAEDWKYSPGESEMAEVWDAAPGTHDGDVENEIDYTYFDFDPNQKNNPWQNLDSSVAAAAELETGKSFAPSQNIAIVAGLEDENETRRIKLHRKTRKYVVSILTVMGVLGGAIAVLALLKSLGLI